MVSELRAESAFELTDDDLYPGLSYPEDTDRDDKQLMLEHSFNVQGDVTDINEWFIWIYSVSTWLLILSKRVITNQRPIYSDVYISPPCPQKPARSIYEANKVRRNLQNWGALITVNAKLS